MYDLFRSPRDASRVTPRPRSLSLLLGGLAADAPTARTPAAAAKPARVHDEPHRHHGRQLRALAVVPITKNGHTLDLKQVTIVVERASSSVRSRDACSGDDDEHEAKWSAVESCAEVKIGPTLVDLPLDTRHRDAADAISFPPARSARSSSASRSRGSIGTFDGNAFDVTFPVNAKAEIQFTTPIVVTDSTPTSITINVPIAGVADERRRLARRSATAVHQLDPGRCRQSAHRGDVPRVRGRGPRRP